ncbi:MAG: DJ-1/PfpI family protein [Planctomycetes bacterium]|nr:DJ-1/PfpI family protein [Planctomycetota bacterium]
MGQSETRVLVLLADGTEEMEFTIVVDVLRRAGVDVVVAGLDGPQAVTCSRGVKIVPDTALADVRGSFRVIVLPGGGDAARRFRESAALGELLRAQVTAGRELAAICAAPSALAAHGVGAGARLTCHPAVRDAVAAHGRYVADAPVVEDGQLVTSRGPGTAFEFAFALVRRLGGDAAVERVRKPMEFATR